MLTDRDETNTQFVYIFAWLRKDQNTKSVLRYKNTMNDFSALIVAYFVINY